MILYTCDVVAPTHSDESTRSVGSAVALATLPVQHRDVVVLLWPSERAEVERLSSAGAPRLLLVEADADPPDGGDCLEDWVRLPADDRDVAARLRALSVRAERHRTMPVVDGYGRLVHGAQWVGLSPIEETLVRALLERFGEVVTYPELRSRGWPNEAPSANALRVHVFRIRRRIEPLGLEVRNVRGWGVLLDHAAAR